MFTKKTWADREVEHPNRRRIDIVEDDTTYQIIDVTRQEGVVTKSGDAFSAANMNGLETRVYNGVHACDNMMGTVMDNTAASEELPVGRYFVHQGNFYVVTRTIPNGGAINPGTNCTRTRISTVLTSLNNGFTSLKNSVTSRINSVEQALTSAINTINTTLGYHGEAIADIKTNTLGMCHYTLSNITVTGGGFNDGARNVGANIRYGNVVGVIVTAVGGAQADVWGATILDNRPTNCVIHFANLSNPSFSGRVTLEVIVLGRAY